MMKLKVETLQFNLKSVHEQITSGYQTLLGIFLLSHVYLQDSRPKFTGSYKKRFEAGFLVLLKQAMYFNYYFYYLF